jgi:hypothetical protein
MVKQTLSKVINAARLDEICVWQQLRLTLEMVSAILYEGDGGGQPLS